MLRVFNISFSRFIQNCGVIHSIVQLYLHFFLFSVLYLIAVVTCPELTSPSNGTTLGCPGNGAMYYDTVCQFSCNDGYIGSGSQSRRCQQNGTWSGEDFTCQSMLLKLCDNWANSDSYDFSVLSPYESCGAMRTDGNDTTVCCGLLNC